jgi:predicted transposase/invertase (TIGR01784 family)
LKNRIFEKAFQTAEIAQFKPEQLETYETSLKYYRDLKNVVDTSYMEGKFDGIEEGKKESRLEEKIEIARNLLKLGLSADQISKATGLSEDEIAGL